jgi:hypothetical protein
LQYSSLLCRLIPQTVSSTAQCSAILCIALKPEQTMWPGIYNEKIAGYLSEIYCSCGRDYVDWCFWNVTLCNLADTYKHFGETYCLYLQGIQ